MQSIAVLEAQLHTGKKISLRELTGSDELACATEVGEGDRACRQSTSPVVGGDALDRLDRRGTLRCVQRDPRRWGLFTAKEWGQVVEAFSELNRVKVDEVAKFRTTFRLSSQEAR